MGVVIAVSKTTPFAGGSGACDPEFPDGIIYVCIVMEMLT
jgi:hypothetical protein